MLPDNLKYTKDHEWVFIEGDEVKIGITHYAQGELGDIIFVELPSKGDAFKQGDSIGTIEAVKTVADIYTPLDGSIIDVNNALEDAPDLLNSDPYDSGWIVKMKIDDTSFVDRLLTKEEYSALIS